MYIHDRRIVSLLQDVYNSKKVDWIGEEVTAAIRAFVTTLSPKVAEVVGLRYGLSCEVGCQQIPQIALHLNISQREVESLVTQGLKAIKNFLREARLHILEHTPEQTMREVIAHRCRMVAYQQSEEYRVEELPPQFYESYVATHANFSKKADEFLQTRSIILIGEIVTALPSEFEESLECTDEILADITECLARFKLKRGMQVTYEDFGKLMLRRRTMENMILASELARIQLKEMNEEFMDDLGISRRKKKK